MSKALMVVGIVLALLGLGYLAMPAALPVIAAGVMGQALGVVLLVVGAFLIWKKH